MKKYTFLIFIFWFGYSNAQIILPSTIGRQNVIRYTGSQKYITFNPFGLAEPQMAIGAGFGNRFTERSEYFAELSYIAKSAFYNTTIAKLNGFRLIMQYRYHFLQQWRPLINLGEFTARNRERAARQQPFIGVELRLKNYYFPGTNNFVNNNIGDTIYNAPYRAAATVIGGALIFGNTFNISDTWKLETTIGFGGKQKFVQFKNIPVGYEIKKENRPGFGASPIYEATSVPYLQAAIRLKYMLGQ